MTVKTTVITSVRRRAVGIRISLADLAALVAEAVRQGLPPESVVLCLRDGDMATPASGDAAVLARDGEPDMTGFAPRVMEVHSPRSPLVDAMRPIARRGRPRKAKDSPLMEAMR